MKSFNRKRAIILTIVIFIGAITGYYFYTKLSFSEQEAEEAVMTFYHMSKSKSVDKNLYPSFSKIDSYINLKNGFVINNISKNSETGMYDVYAEYIHNESFKYPIVFNVDKEWGKVQIKSSKGLCFHLYNGVFDLGVALNKIRPNATDVEISKAVNRESLEPAYKSMENMELLFLGLQLKLSSNMSSSYNITVSVKNESDYDLNSNDLDCKVEFMDAYGNIVNSKSVHFFSGIAAHQTTSESVLYLSLFENSERYKPVCKIVKTANITAILKEIILSNVRNGKVIVENGNISYI